MTRNWNRNRRHVDLRDIDPFRGNIEALERAEKAYDEKMAQEKADERERIGIGVSGSGAGDDRNRHEDSPGSKRDTRPPTEVTKEMVERSAALNSTGTTTPHVVQTESRNTECEEMRKKADMSKLDKAVLLAHCLGMKQVWDTTVTLTPNTALIAEILEFKEGAINKLLNKGVNLPGVAFYEVDETRSKGR